MRVILKERLENLGRPGDVVTVKPGYARNYLIPQGFAYEATDANLRRIERERAQLEKREEEALSAARERAGSLEGVALSFTARASEEGKLFGSITSADIAEKLAEQGLDIERKQVVLHEPIRMIGEFAVPIRLHADVRPEITVTVARED
jgi:large subunit ribosomal protein L9